MTNEATNVAIYLARRLSGETLATIGKSFGMSNYSSVSSVVCRMNNEIRADASLRRRVERIEREFQMSDLTPQLTPEHNLFGAVVRRR